MASAHASNPIDQPPPHPRDDCWPTLAWELRARGVPEDLVLASEVDPHDVGSAVDSFVVHAAVVCNVSPFLETRLAQLLLLPDQHPQTPLAPNLESFAPRRAALFARAPAGTVTLPTFAMPSQVSSAALSTFLDFAYTVEVYGSCPAHSKALPNTLTAFLDARTWTRKQQQRHRHRQQQPPPAADKTDQDPPVLKLVSDGQHPQTRGLAEETEPEDGGPSFFQALALRSIDLLDAAIFLRSNPFVSFAVAQARAFGAAMLQDHKCSAPGGRHRERISKHLFDYAQAVHSLCPATACEPLLEPLRDLCFEIFGYLAPSPIHLLAARTSLASTDPDFWPQYDAFWARCARRDRTVGGSRTFASLCTKRRRTDDAVVLVAGSEDDASEDGDLLVTIRHSSQNPPSKCRPQPSPPSREDGTSEGDSSSSSRSSCSSSSSSSSSEEEGGD